MHAKSNNKILITGGYGYIGSHTIVALQTVGYEVIVVDNLSNSTKKIGRNLEIICKKTHKFYEINILNFDELLNCFIKEKPAAVIHFAGLKAVEESVKNPLLYYKNNLQGTINLLDIMGKVDCNNIIFSSSATVYGNPSEMPINEKHIVNAINPYGSTKLFCEKIIDDWVKVNKKRSSTILRYFNPIGAHESYLIGDNPNSVPNNLMPYIVSVANGTLEKVSIFGDDYPTKDGTGIRDYIHVMDLAEAHVLAILNDQRGRSRVYNLGTGKGISVLELIKTFEIENKVKVKYTISSRREGDAAEVYADVKLVKDQLNWSANRTLKEMCKSAWSFGKNL